MYRHVLCVYPHRVEYRRGHRMYPPIGLEIIAAQLRPFARRIDVVDLRYERGRRTASFVRPETDLVCVSVNWDLDIDFVVEEINSLPRNVLTVVGGRHATDDPMKWMNACPGIDLLVRGDGEEAIVEIAEGKRPCDIAGVSYRTAGGVVHGPAREMKPMPDDVRPDRSMRRYTYSLEAGGFPVMSFDLIASSRGCPYRCKFCSFNSNPLGKKRSFSARSAEAVVQEIAETDARAILFADDNFAFDIERVSAICDLIVQRGIKKVLMAQTRVEVARRPDVLEKMARAGFTVLFFGVESAQDKTLKALNKGFTTEQVREYFSVLRRSGMLLFGYFLLGSIGESETEMREITPFARELGLDDVYLCPLRNEPHSAIAELVAANPGYHIAPSGFVYSDQIPLERLDIVRRGIKRHFSSLRNRLGILRKAYRLRLFRLRMLPDVFWFALRKVREHRVRRARRRASGAAAAAPER